MQIISNRYIFLTLSGLLVLASIVSILSFGFKEAIDFAGGTLWSLKFEKEPQTKEVKDLFYQTFSLDISASKGSAGEFILRAKELTEVEHQNYLKALTEKFGNVTELSFQSIGPSVGSEVRRAAMVAIALVLLGISIYIAFAFKNVSRPISSWKYGAVTLVTLLHDVAIPAGLFALLGHYFGAEVDTNFIVALLVVMGFSVHDTIVVFDRIRENLILARDRSDLKGIVNKSINETMARSINTSLTLIVVLVALYILGPETLKYFILTILVGVTAGTYSSIFVASPLITVWHDKNPFQK